MADVRRPNKDALVRELSGELAIAVGLVAMDAEKRKDAGFKPSGTHSAMLEGARKIVDAFQNAGVDASKLGGDAAASSRAKDMLSKVGMDELVELRYAVEMANRAMTGMLVGVRRLEKTESDEERLIRMSRVHD